ncbi:hypothetical protein V5O48_008246 [Marasmius crinis-equi]|uniref:Uncharacterized protein n=1 Tax=Marasmius crinis-equi TaxID=585013 RepID=A0ABR3FEE0_9AGAR
MDVAIEREAWLSTLIEQGQQKDTPSVETYPSTTTTMTSPGWRAPPTRREIAISLFCLFTFTFTYLLSAATDDRDLLIIQPLTRHLKSFTSTTSDSTQTQSLPSRPESEIDDDIVYGSFSWKPHRVANDIRGDGFPKRIEYYTEEEVYVKFAERNGSMVVGAPKAVEDYQTWPYTCFWMGVDERDKLWGSYRTLGEGERAHETIWRWEAAEEVEEGEGGPWRGPVGKVLKHVDGFTVIDNVYLYDGIVYIVTDEPRNSLPSINAIVDGESGMQHSRWEYISTREAKTRLGLFAGVIRGVSWMIMDLEPHNATLFGLQKMHSSLATLDSDSTTCQGRSFFPSFANTCPSSSKARPNTVAPPARLIYPNLPAFSDSKDGIDEDEKGHFPPRRRSETGYHPYTLKAAFPSLSGVIYKEDWKDYVRIGLKERTRANKPGWVFERVVVARGSSSVGFASPGEVFRTDPDEGWLDQPRMNMEGFLGLGVQGGAPRKAGAPGWGNSLMAKRKRKTVAVLLGSTRPQGTEQLLSRLEGDTNIETHILDLSSSWAHRMRAVTGTQILVCLGRGSGGRCGLEAVWMAPGQRSVVIDIVEKEEDWDETGKVVSESLGMRYRRVGVPGKAIGLVEQALAGRLY